MEISSPAFQHNQYVPAKYTCDGEDLNPPLQFTDVPEGTQTLALLVDDPDAPVGDWVHWLMWNIPPSTTEIPENSVPADAIQGLTDFGRNDWGGPCPPNGMHRYFFKLYALDSALDLPPTIKKADFLAAIEGHVLAEAKLIGLYDRVK